MKNTGKPQQPQGPSQRQVEILREEELADPVLQGVSITISEVRVSPDLRHAHVFAEPLGGKNAVEVVKGLNRVSKFLRGRLGHMIDMKFTPDLKFLHDDSFNTATAIDRLFDDPRVQADLAKREPTED